MKSCVLFAVSLIVATAPVEAVDLAVGDSGITAKLDSELSIGTAVRTSSQNKSLLGRSFASSGLPKGGTAQDVTDDGDLNFGKGDLVSSPLKLFSRLTLQKNDFSVVVSARAWTDFTLRNGDVPQGNTPNGYVFNRPLSDRGFNSLNKFSNIVPWEAYGAGHWSLGQNDLTLKVGRLTQIWSTAEYFVDSSRISAIDLTALSKPGVLTDREINIPTGTVDVGFKTHSGVEVEAFYQLENRSDNLQGCGTFLSDANIGFDSTCAGAVLNTFVPGNALYLPASYGNWDNSAFSVANGLGVPRISDVHHGGHSQGGMAVRFEVKPISAKVGLYFLNLQSRLPSLSVTASNNPAAITMPDPILLAAGAPAAIASLSSALKSLGYYFEYPGNIRTVGINVAKKIAGWDVAAEFEYVGNQPVTLNSADIISGLLGQGGPFIARLEGKQPGAPVHGYDRLHNERLDLNAARGFSDVFGAKTLKIIAEADYQRVSNLPPLGSARYGRSFLYGFSSAGYGGIDACAATENPGGGDLAGCFNKGFVTKDAFAYRIHAVLSYEIGHKAALSPSITWLHDVTGYSADGQIIKGREQLVSGAELTYGKVSIGSSWHHTVRSATYDVFKDRDYVEMHASVKL